MRFIALLASQPEAAGCEVSLHHVSADGDRLIGLTAVGVDAEAGGASVLVGDDNTFSSC